MPRTDNLLALLQPFSTTITEKFSINIPCNPEDQLNSYAYSVLATPRYIQKFWEELRVGKGLFAEVRNEVWDFSVL